MASSSCGVEFVVVQFPYLENKFIHQLTNVPPGTILSFRLEIIIFGPLSPASREIARSLPLAEVQCYSLLYQIVVLLLRNSYFVPQYQIASRQEQVIEEIIDFMYKHSHEAIHIQDLAQNRGISPQYFRKLFKSRVGLAPKKYLTTLRIQRSECLLLHEEYSITEIAMQLGFSSAQQFAKVFKKK